MSDGGRERASLGLNVWKSSQKWGAQRSAVRSIAWLGAWREFVVIRPMPIGDRLETHTATAEIFAKISLCPTATWTNHSPHRGGPSRVAPSENEHGKDD